MKKVLSLLAVAFAALANSPLAAAVQFGFQDPETPIARQIYSLHTLILWICVVIFVLVFGAMFYAIINHRKSVGHKAAQFHENTQVEIIWTLVPFLILMGMAWPATKTIIEMKDTSNPDLTIKATGYQWLWGYEYVKGEGDLAGVSDGIQIFSRLATPMEQIYDKSANKDDHYLLEVDHELVVPVNKKIRILTTAADVIHSWWVPAFGVKQDAIPGYIRDTWFKAEKTGVYRGQCAELCGKEHGFMPIVVRVVDNAEFQDWASKHRSDASPAAATSAPSAEAAPAAAEATQVAAAEPAASSGASAPAADGKATYDGLCSACHAMGIAGAPKFGDKAAWAPRIAQGVDTLHQHAIHGFKTMPAKGGNPALSDATVMAAVDYMVSQSK
ncbi:MAG: cytochrome c oxidase subunit II [Betaproteobacteria bacterium]|nr:cytochrome c oxidase subunit II [Betaproteobacteria bacterium]